MTNEPFINYILQFGSLNEQQIKLINNSLKVKTYKTKEYFLKAGQISNEIGFIQNGIFRVCYYDNDGNEITRYFIDETNFIVDMNSYNTGLASTEYIQAVTECEVSILTKKAMDNLSGTIIVWDNIIGKITAKALSEKVARVSIMIPKDATSRYEYFLDNFPNLANRVPLQYLASYIGVTQSSLSRLRREIAKKR